MVKVECDGCKAPYQIDEKRIPPTGLKMRCPKCGTNLLVTKPTGDVDLPAIPARPAAGPPGAPPAPRGAPPRPPPPPRPKAAAAAPAFGEIDAGPGFGEIDLMVDLPAPGGPPPGADSDLPAIRGAPAPAFGAPSPYGNVDLPAVHGGGSDLPMSAPARGSWEARGGPPTPVADPHQGHADLPSPAGHTDLPSPAGGRTDLPMPAGRGGPPPPPARQRSATVNFGDIDLPAAPSAGLPVAMGGPQRSPQPPPAPQGYPPAPPRARSKTVNFGDIDLPSIPAEGMPGAGRGFGEIDLPLVADDGGLPAPGGGAGLPVPGGAGLPAYGAEAGGVGLPAPAYGAGLPAPAYGAGLPAPAYGAGLPAPAYGAGLPAPAHGAGLPAPAYGPGLPAPAYGAGLPAPAQGAGLPAAAYGSGLPMPAQGQGLPMPAQGQGLPMAAYGSGLPMPAQGQGYPMPVQGGGLPMPAQGQGYPMPVQGGGLPMSAQGQGFPMAADVGLPARFGEVDMGDEMRLDDGEQGRANAFDDSDRAVPGQMDAGGGLGSVGIDLAGPTRATVGDEVDLGVTPGAGGEAAQPSQRRARPAEAPVKKGNARKVGVFVAVAATLTGGAFSLVPTVGPFGVYFVSDKLNAKSNAQALEGVRKGVGTLLDEDTHAAVSEAIERCKEGRAPMPRYAPATAYCAYVALERGLRFGRRTDDEAFAKQLLASAGDAGGESAILATAALDILAGQPAKARGPVAALAQKAPQDIDVAVVVADVELSDKAAVKAAVGAWKTAVTAHKSARTLFGLARAQVAAGDPKGAEASGRAVVVASPAHAGARTLIASAISSDSTREAEALELLKQVTDDGPVSKAASDAELVDAFTTIGTIHLSRSRMSAAEQAFAAALKKNPLAVRALVGNGELFYRSGRYSEALARFEAATNADPEGVVAKVGIAKTYISLERMKESKDMLKKLREARPGEPLVLLWLGKADEALGNKKEAEASYVEAIKAGENRPEVVDAYVALSHLLSAVGRIEDANAKLAEASKKFPDFPALHRAKGEVALQMGRYDEARVELEAALAKEEDLYARFRLGVALRRMRRFAEAGAIFDKVASIDKDYPGLALERGLLFEETGQSDLALESYRKALEKAPNDIDLKLRVGSTQVMAGHARDAEKILEEVRKARPNSAEANHFLGRALLVRGENLAEAMRYLELAVNIDSNRPEYFLYVGWAANELGQSAKAAPALNKALELDHELGDAYWQRGVLLQKQGATQDALRDLNTALEKRPSRFEAWATIAMCDQDMQKWPEAERAWRAAIAGNDEQPDWHYRLGKLLDSHGNRAGVVPELEKAIELASRPDAAHYTWLYDAHFILAEALHRSPANKAKTIEHYQRFLELAPPGIAYRQDAEKALLGMGVRQNR